MAAYINDYRTNIIDFEGPQGRQPNVMCIDCIHNGEVKIYVINTKPIKKGEQLLLDYGLIFWENYHTVVSRNAGVRIELEDERNRHAMTKTRLQLVINEKNEEITKLTQKITALQKKLAETTNNIDSSDNNILLARKEKEISELKKKINLMQAQNVVIV